MVAGGNWGETTAAGRGERGTPTSATGYWWGNVWDMGRDHCLGEGGWGDTTAGGVGHTRLCQGVAVGGMRRGVRGRSRAPCGLAEHPAAGRPVAVGKAAPAPRPALGGCTLGALVAPTPPLLGGV